MSAQKLLASHPLSRKFSTAEEGAKAKTEYLVNTVLNGFDWDKFIQSKSQPKVEK